MDDEGPFEDPYICPGCGEELVPREPFELAHELIEIRGFGLGEQEPGTGRSSAFTPATSRSRSGASATGSSSATASSKNSPCHTRVYTRGAHSRHTGTRDRLF